MKTISKKASWLAPLCVGKRAQNPSASYAVPVILMATAVLFLFYLIMLYPWERASLLGYNNTTANQSPLGPGTEILYSNGEISEVGTGSGGVVSTFQMNNFLVSYPAVPVIVDSSSVSGISANILSSDTILLNANNVDTSNVKGLLLKINITSVVGSPKLIVMLNSTTIYSSSATTGLLEINIPAASLRANNPVYIKLYNTGWFWEVQQVKFSSATLYRIEYEANVPSQSQTVPISANNYQGNTFKIVFTPTVANTDGSLLLKINDQQVWAGRPLAGIQSEASVNLDKSNIVVGNNKIEFAAAQGGEYTLSNVSLQFVAESSPAANKVYSFNIDHDKLYSGRAIKVGVLLDHIISPGTLHVQIIPYDTTYYFANAQLNPGIWIYTNLDKTKLKELGNQLMVNSLDGRFRISGFMIVLA